MLTPKAIFSVFCIVPDRTVCGLPFKKLDKKAEKKLLFSRKQALSQRLLQLSNNDPMEILELVILLIYQQVRQAIVVTPGTVQSSAVGPSTTTTTTTRWMNLLRGPILEMLLQERKVINTDTSKALLALNKQLLLVSVEDEVDTDNLQTTMDSLVDMVKECGLSRDITKHTIDDLGRVLLNLERS